MKTKARTSLFKVPNIKVKALLSGMNSNSTCEIKNKEVEKIMEIYDSLQTGTYMNNRIESNRFYNGCMLEVSANKYIHVFNGYAILNENTTNEVRVDKDKKLEKELLKNLNLSPMIKNLIFELSTNKEITIKV